MNLERLYYVLAVAGFVGTGSQVLDYTGAGFFGGTADFWDDVFTTTAAARFLAIDIFVLGAAIFVLLWVESRKVGIAAKWFWGYAAGSLLIGISTFVPLFLAHRERVLRSVGSGT